MTGTSGRSVLLLLSTTVLLLGCERAPAPDATEPAPGGAAPPPGAGASRPQERALRYRNVAAETDYVGDAACTTCHEEAASAYQAHGMA
ncbi:MAG: hypothetical protein ACRELC_00960, partial [Gemmatimonadota bacterium]